jgi:hypothetical protein
MKTILKPAVAGLLCCACMHDFQNPSDPQAGDYSSHSHAVLRILSRDTLRAGDTVPIFGGISSSAVEEVGLVTEFRWDFNGDGETDTVLFKSDTLGVTYNDTGVFRCRIVLFDGAEFTDTALTTLRIRVRTDTTHTFDTFRIIVNSKDTVRVIIVDKKPATVIIPLGDTITVVPRTKDSIAVITHKTDTLVIKPADTIRISIIPHDTVPPPPSGIYIPTFPTIPGFPNIIKGECAFYTTDSSLMHTTLNFYDIMWEQTRSDGLQAIEFAEKLVADIMGYSVITLIAGNYSYAFTNGIYQFNSSNGFTLTCVFHYGADAGGHAEDDTVRANLFLLDSYVSGLKVTLSPPYYSFTKGPLFDLIDGEPVIDQSLHVTFSVNFSKLKISFVRSTIHPSVALPFYIVNDSVRLPVTHTSISRMKPTPMLSFDDLFNKDSIMIDHGGSSMGSTPVPFYITYRSDSIYRKTKYSFAIEQKMDMQQTAYGNRNGTLKLSGEYEAQASLGFDNLKDSVFFKGRYSSSVPDSSRFFCDKQKAKEFGTLFFSLVPVDTGTFTSKKYGYAFPYTPIRVTLEDYLKRK